MESVEIKIKTNKFGKGRIPGKEFECSFELKQRVKQKQRMAQDEDYDREGDEKELDDKETVEMV